MKRNRFTVEPEHRAVMSGQGKSRRDMNLPPLNVIRDTHCHLVRRYGL